MDGPTTWEDPFWPHGGPTGISQPKCVDIPENLTLCQDIGYKKMRIPNLLGHDNLAEVTQQAGSWIALNNIKCSEHTQLFLCSLFSPICLDKEILPCKSLCEAVKAGCGGRMSSYGFPWPDMVRCDKFPEDNGLCIKPPTEGKTNVEDRSCPCREPDTFEGIVDNFCRADFVMNIKIRKKRQKGTRLILLPAKKKKAYKKENLTKRESRRPVFVLPDNPSCDCPLPTGNDKFLVMGHKKNDQLVLSFILKWDAANNRTIRRALRVLRKKKNICKGGVEVLNVEKRQKRRKRKRNRNRDRDDRKATSRRPSGMINDEQ